MATQGERRRATRTALLDAGARLFAEHGVAESSVDAIARAAGRTSGALYDHFGNKEGLLFALLEGWADDVAAVITAELVNTHSLEERMAALWRNVSDPAIGNGRWIGLEHELWSYAARHETARERLVERYRAAWDGLSVLTTEPAEDAPGGPADAAASQIRSAPDAGVAILGLVLGLEMMRRVDPAAVTDELAVAALCGVAASTPLGAPT